MKSRKNEEIPMQANKFGLGAPVPTDDLIEKSFHSDGKKEFRKDFAKAKSEFKSIVPTHTNTFYDSKYADLADYHHAVDEALLKNGFTLHQLLESDGNKNFLITKLCHVTGWEESSRVMLCSKDEHDPQKIGSSITYFRRYSIASLLGIPMEDDDGSGGADKHNLDPEEFEYDPNWIIPVGKYKTKVISEIPTDQLLSYIDYLEKSGPVKGALLTVKLSADWRKEHGL